jgi:adenylate cyclase
MPPNSGRPANLLVVDDNRVSRLLLARTLQQDGHTVGFAENGRLALEMLHRQPFDLVLLDMMMPELDGEQVLAHLTADPQLRNVPVIMISANDDVDGVVRCIEMGAEDYLTKPPNPVLLRARINASLEKKRLRDQQRELVRRFATAEVADELLQTSFELGGKYVEATAMFSDIRGFTSLTESQSPADTIELLNTYYTLMFDAIQGHAGIVNQIVGDGLMAIFGAPVVRDDHCLRAVRAGREMVELVQMFNLDQLAAGKQPIQIGVGIASGRVIAGFTGTQDRATYTCVGDTVNLAARLESHTKVVGQPILIDEATQAALAGAIDTVPQGDVQLKGKARAVSIFSVPVSGLMTEPAA